MGPVGRKNMTFSMTQNSFRNNTAVILQKRHPYLRRDLPFHQYPYHQVVLLLGRFLVGAPCHVSALKLLSQLPALGEALVSLIREPQEGHVPVGNMGETLT